MGSVMACTIGETCFVTEGVNVRRRESDWEKVPLTSLVDDELRLERVVCWTGLGDLCR